MLTTDDIVKYLDTHDKINMKESALGCKREQRFKSKLLRW